MKKLLSKQAIYFICDKYEFPSSLVFSFYATPQLKCKSASFAVSFQRMNLLVNFKQKLVENNVSAQINVMMCPKTLEWSSLFVKEMNMLFRAQLQTETYFETGRAIWLPKLFALSKYFFLYILLAETKIAILD